VWKITGPDHPKLDEGLTSDQPVEEPVRTTLATAFLLDRFAGPLRGVYEGMEDIPTDSC
jgi:hypothetical protein